MFFTFVNKDNPHYLDLSVMIKYNPEEVLFYFYDSFINISWESYLKVKTLAEGMDNEDKSPLQKWQELFDDHLEAANDLITLKDNGFIRCCGPYYYNPSNTRFYFIKNSFSSSELINSEDMTSLMALHEAPNANKELLSYFKKKKTSKKAARNKDELIKDISMCLSCLKEIEKLNQHVNYLNKLLEQRSHLLKITDLSPAEPDNIPEKPSKPEDNEKPLNNIIPFSFIQYRSSRQHAKNGNLYNHEMKIYFIRYREYEKACDRFKKTLENWPTDFKNFKESCEKDIRDAEEKLKTAQEYLKIYSSIIQHSAIHANYQDMKILELFKYYLNTGRAYGIQECMNIFEEERHWREIKASQERIENTIYFLQNDNPDIRRAEEQIDNFLNQINRKTVLAEA
ncbi:MAG: hypothetical protein ABFD08_06870 [Syntrophomonas sp.]